MAHFKRRRPRTSAAKRGSRPRGYWLASWPAYHDILFHNRPRRRKESRLLLKVRLDLVDPDDVAWPLGNNKPHVYYW